ncbi:terminase small subunit [Streptococcus thermophilus]|uniref:terminase small subunit n=1 Tax=Streptococcus thermophilus TaxID=1308 RepID=UPI0022EA6707|nr:terminase small subunit [Streptococcus thermophilus]MDA3774873.1 terminase small subunit [Streptococcus thermophilus]
MHKKSSNEGGGHIGLNQRQRLFVSEYIKLGNGTQAAINAGYSPKTSGAQAEKLLKKVEIKNSINAEIEKLHNENIMDAKEALSILSDIARGKRDEEIVMMNPVSGEVERVTKKADNNTVIKAITEILKRYPTAKQAEKMQLEIEKLKSQISGDEGQDEKIAGFLNIIKGAVSDGSE